MNLEKLRHAESSFLEKYPSGFDDPELIVHAKRHKLDKMVPLTQAEFAADKFNDPEMIVESFVKIVSRSSLVSVFEKPKLRDFVNSLNPQEKEFLANGLYQRLHGNEQNGFNMIVDILQTGKVAKWPVITICPVYFNPHVDVFVKPTTAKNVIDVFELESLVYKSTPTWAFYEAYRTILNDMKSKVDPRISPNNPTFTGFLMMSM
ncbi:hypothetical protein JW960_26040 [candidate division KSB1 bacterium]|nr:hypothetical protein [candidate division KSB1 bacterium]